MEATYDQDFELRALIIEISEIYHSAQTDGNGYPNADLAKAKTANFLRATARVSALAKEIAANGESNRKALTPKDVGDMAGKMNGKIDPKSMNAASSITVDGKIAPWVIDEMDRRRVADAKKKADATAKRIQNGRRG